MHMDLVPRNAARAVLSEAHENRPALGESQKEHQPNKTKDAVEHECEQASFCETRSLPTAGISCADHIRAGSSRRRWGELAHRCPRVKDKLGLSEVNVMEEAGRSN